MLTADNFHTFLHFAIPGLNFALIIFMIAFLFRIRRQINSIVEQHKLMCNVVENSVGNVQEGFVYVTELINTKIEYMKRRQNHAYGMVIEYGKLMEKNNEALAVHDKKVDQVRESLIRIIAQLEAHRPQ